MIIFLLCFYLTYSERILFIEFSVKIKELTFNFHLKDIIVFFLFYFLSSLIKTNWLFEINEDKNKFFPIHSNHLMAFHLIASKIQLEEEYCKIMVRCRCWDVETKFAIGHSLVYSEIRYFIFKIEWVMMISILTLVTYMFSLKNLPLVSYTHFLQIHSNYHH